MLYSFLKISHFNLVTKSRRGAKASLANIVSIGEPAASIGLLLSFEVRWEQISCHFAYHLLTIMSPIDL